MLAFGRQGRLLRSAYGACGSASTNSVAASSSTWRPSSAATFATSGRAQKQSLETTEGAVSSSTSAVKLEESPLPQGSVSKETNKAASADGVKQQKAKKPKKAPMHFDLASFPSLLREPHPVLDAYVHHELPVSKETPYGASVTIYNSPNYFAPSPPTAADMIEGGGLISSTTKNPEQGLASTIPLSTQEVSKLHRHLLKMRRVVQQTGKGRQARMSAFIVTGNGKGMVGIGDGKDATASVAVRKAYHDAVRNMDYVERADGHTIPSTVTGKWSSSVVVLRPRPPGFGLRVPPVIHAIARCAGIADMSATIHRSSNPLNVAKATLKVLWGGSAPLGMGNGVDGKMRRVDKGRGMRGVRDIEMARGRRLREVSAAKE